MFGNSAFAEAPFAAIPAASAVVSGASNIWDLAASRRLLKAAVLTMAAISPEFVPAAAAATQAYGANDSWDSQPRSHVVKAATLDVAAIYRPLGTTPQGYEAQVPVLFAKPFPATLQDFGKFDPQGTITTVRYGSRDEWPARFARGFPAVQQPATGDQWIGNVPTAFVGNAWVVYPERFARKFPVVYQDPLGFTAEGLITTVRYGASDIWPERFGKRFPVQDQQVQPDTWIGNVSTAFIGNAWLIAWDGPSRKPFPPAAQQVTSFPEQGVITTVRYGASDLWPERFGRPVKAALQKYEESYPAQGNVPTVFVGNAWVAVWDGPARKRFPSALQRDVQQPDAVYSSVVVTFPDGWQVVAADMARPRRPAQGAELQISAAQAVPQGWGTLVPDIGRRRVVDHLYAAWAAQPAAAAYSAWIVTPDLPARLRLPAAPDAPLVVPAAFSPSAWIVTSDRIQGRRASTPGAETIGQVQAVFVFTSWDVWPAPHFRPAVQAKREPVRPPDKPPVFAAPGNTDLWSSVSHAFRIIRPAPPDYYRLWRITPRIVSQPPLVGTSAAPTLLGVSTAPSLIGVSTGPNLIGVSTGPSLLGTSTGPTLLGQV